MSAVGGILLVAEALNSDNFTASYLLILDLVFVIWPTAVPNYCPCLTMEPLTRSSFEFFSIPSSTTSFSAF